VLATQEERFREVLSIVPEGLMVHLSNSASLYNGRFPYATHFRPGISLYGYGHPGLKPVLSLKARVIHEHVLEPGEGLSYGWTWRATEPTHVVTVPVGYGDGYNRKLSNKAIAGSKAGSLQQIGTVTMDFTMFKAPKNVAVGDEIVLMGEWEEGHFWADEMAQVIGSIPYEVLTSINPRVPRVLV
jgi:alanine racemase